MNIDFIASKSGQFKKLTFYGQSPWLDNISRCMINSGELEKLIQNGVITGITSNPSIFEKAINSEKCGYPEAIKSLLQKDLTPFQIYDTITRDDIKSTALLLKPVYEKSGGRDGFVSIEVAPDIATNVSTSISEAQRIFSLIDEKNVLIKIPATNEGLEVISALISQGINVNATLMFSRNHYIAVSTAYIEGLKKAIKSGLNLRDIHSVASIFISRVDTYIDKLLNELITGTDASASAKKEKIMDLKGKAAVANSKIIFNKYKETFSGAEFMALKAKGANGQRLLFASTSTKDPSYYDLKYVEPLIGRNTVSTLPDETIEHIADHGKLSPDTASQELENSKKILAELSELGIDLDEVGEKLQEDGVKSFENSYDKLLDSIKNIARNI